MNSKKESIKYTLLGICFGFLFPIIAIVLDLNKQQLSFSFPNILALHLKSPVHFIIDTAPIVLGFFAFIAGKRQDKIIEIIKNQDQTIQKTTEELRINLSYIEKLLEKEKSNNAQLQELNNKYLTSNEELSSIQEELHQNVQYQNRINYELTKKENIIQEQLEYQNALLNGTELSIISTYPNGIIKTFNKGAQKLLGYSANEIIDIHSPAIIHDANEIIERTNIINKELSLNLEPGFETFVIKSKEGVADTNEWTYIHKNGKRIPVLLSITTLRNRDNEIIAYLGIAVDISERKKQEQQLLTAIKEKERIEQAANIRQSFLTGISHEIRTPMNSIIGLSNLLEKTSPLNDKQNEYIKTININSNHLLKIINEILDFSKIEAGKIELSFANCQLHELINNTTISLRNLATAKNLTVKVIIADNVPLIVNTDEVKLNQILVNLISNAIKYTGKGEIIIEAKLVSSTSLYDEIMFSVKDTGIGISKEKQKMIFNPFTQGEDFYTKSQGGSGLGLSIAEKLAELFGSKINLESEIDKGSNFFFNLKMKKNNSPYLESISTDNISENNTHQKLDLLLVEDNEFNRLVLIDTLKSHYKNISIEIAENGQIAVDKVKTKNYQLIIMDIQMPVMDGHEATKKIRNELKCNTPILAMTAHASIKEKENCFSNGMNDFITKPFEEKILFQKVDALSFENIKKNETNSQKNNYLHNSEESLVDTNFILEFTKGKRERLEKMVHLFIKDTPKELDKLQEYYHLQNFSALKTLAHSLKPKFTYMGMPSLSELAKKIEKEALNENNIEDIQNDILLLTEKVKSTYIILETLIK